MVVDASAAIDLLLHAAREPSLVALLSRPGTRLHAPHLLDVEVLHALRRLAASGQVDEERAEEVRADLLALTVQRHPHTVLLDRAWELRGTVSAYDAMYVALAELLDAPLVTRDARLARSHGHQARIELV